MNQRESKRERHVSSRLLSLFICFVAATIAAVGQQPDAPIQARVLTPPVPTRGSDGKMHIEYEVHVTGSYAGNGPLRLTKLRAFAQGAEAPLASYEGKELCALARPRCPEAGDGVPLAAGERVVFLMWLTLPRGQAAVTALWHSIGFDDAKGRRRAQRCAEVVLDRRPAIVIGPPFRGDRLWLVTEGPGNAGSHHWGALLDLNGRVTIPQRFAIDFVGLNAAGHALPVARDAPRASQNSAWFGYDADVLAVADGVVSDARDGEPDGQPFTQHVESGDLSPRGLYGNFVILNIAPGVYVHYAHLRPGSVRVHADDHVHRGDVIAHVGDSGNSSVPHLHFHISDKPVYAGSEGLPFRFAQFTLEGKAGPEVVLSPSSTWNPQPSAQHLEMPLDSDVIGFP
jgi:Peptidase family M23